MEWSPPDPVERAREIDIALGAYGCRARGAPEPVADSVRNENYRVLTERGPLFVRFHRPSRTRERLQREHRVINWAGVQGLPVVRPLASDSGDTLREVAGRLVAVFPWIEGHTLRRGQITAGEASTMGAMHGRLHATLARYSDHDLPEFWGVWGWDAERTLDELGRFAEMLPTVDLAPDERDLVRCKLEAQRRGLERASASGANDFEPRGVQPVHGDYHERNVMFGPSGAVVAVVDWDMVVRMPRVFEVVRALTLSGLLEPPLLAAYVGAYHREVTLTPEECELGVELWWQFMLHDTWLYRVRLLEKDPAVQPYFAQGVVHLARFGDASFRAHVAGELRRRHWGARPPDPPTRLAGGTC